MGRSTFDGSQSTFTKGHTTFKMPRSTFGFSGQPDHVSINSGIICSILATRSQLYTRDDQLLTGVNQLSQKVTRLLRCLVQLLVSAVKLCTFRSSSESYALHLPLAVHLSYDPINF